MVVVVAIDSSFDKIPSLQIRRLVTSIVKLRLNELRLVKGATSFQNLKLRVLLTLLLEGRGQGKQQAPIKDQNRGPSQF